MFVLSSFTQCATIYYRKCSLFVAAQTIVTGEVNAFRVGLRMRSVNESYPLLRMGAWVY